MLPEEFREDLRRSRAAVEAAAGLRVEGFRAAHGWLRAKDLWVLDMLADEGFAYDSSINPIFRRFSDQPVRFDVHTHTSASTGRELREFPIATTTVLGLRLAISGGIYVRQFPHALLRRAVARRTRRNSTPQVFYFLTWEMDPTHPHLATVSAVTRIRHYRNLERTRRAFEDHFLHYRFQSIREYLQLPQRQLARPADTLEPPVRNVVTVETMELEEVSLVVPLFNEQQNLGYLQRTLAEMRSRLASRYRIHLVLVDDASNDGTWPELNSRFASVADCLLVRQPKNEGVARAILAGIRCAPTETVCSLDCDCSYDPYDLGAMIPLLADGDMVTASPYHPNGNVLNVPRWRLLLSKTLSRLYSLVLGERFYTYTSCCRVYRRAAFESLPVRHGGFLGVAETLIGAKLRGLRIVEYPATLESRLLGESKMSVIRTVWGHLGILGELALRRLRGEETEVFRRTKNG